MKNEHPPKTAQRFLQRFLRDEIAEEVLGDLDEKFYTLIKNKSVFRARVNYWYQTMNYLRPFAMRKSRSVQSNHYTMYQSYVKVGWRNLWKNKVFSSINIVGLAAGMTVAMLIGLWIWDELSFDSYFQNREHLAQVMIKSTDKGETYTGGTVAMPLGEALRTKYSADIKALSLLSWNNPHVVTVGEKKLSARGRWVQADFPHMFTLKMLGGSPDALKDPSSVLIASSLAKMIFGDTDPINKTIRIDNRLDMTVGGVFEDLPHNTTFYETKFLLPWDNKENWMNATDNWMNHCGELFVQLHDHADFEATSQKIKNIPTPYITKWTEEAMLHPMSKVHLYNEFENGKIAGGRIKFVWLFGTIGVFVLLLACINFMNLSTARSEKRAKEVGIRKSIGSVQTQLVTQFLMESLVVTLLAFVLSLLLTQLSLSFFNALADKNISIEWSSPIFWAATLGFTLFTGIISGSYPAFYLSAFKPAKVLKGSFKVGHLAIASRKILVVVQFTVSITLIIGTVVVFRQIQFAKNRTAGYSRDGLVTININTPDLEKNYDALKNELLQTSAVTSMARSSQPPSHFGNNNSVDWRGKDPDQVTFFRNVNVTADFGQTIEWNIVLGRDFSEQIASDSSAALINETAVKTMGFKDPLGEVVKFWGKEFTIVGVVQDMVNRSPYQPHDPAIFFNRGDLGIITARLNSTIPVREALTDIEIIFRKHNPTAPFEFDFVDEAFKRKFAGEERIGNLAAFFTTLAVFISCLGLFGLASFVVEQRNKEIGIRKVLGASVTGLWKMLSKDFVVLVVIACCVAMPLSYAAMDEWLTQFQYRTTLSWEIFAASVAGVITLTLMTVSYQALKTATTNPVNSLKSE